MPSPLPDPDFAAYAERGCAQAFRRMVDRYLPMVHSAAARVLGSRAHLAADVAQAVFVLLARRAALLPGDMIVGAWLHRQTVRAALNTLRSENRRAAREASAAYLHAMHHHADHSDHDVDALWLDLQPHVDRAMLRLSATDREALTLRFLETKNLREVGESLGLSTDAAQKRVERALEKLRRHLAPHTARALSATVLAACMAARSVEAAPAHLAARISGGALASVPTASLLTTLFALMTQTKALSLGALAGLISAGAWTLWSPADTASAPQQLSPAASPSRQQSLTAGGVGAVKVARYFPRAALTPEDILAQVQMILAEPDTEASRLRLRGLIAQLSSEQSGKVLALAVEALSKVHLRRFHIELIPCWSRIDGPAAMRAYASLAGEVTNIAGLVGHVFATWLETDPTAAQRWLVENQGAPGFGSFVPLCVNKMAMTLAAQGEDVLLQWAREMVGSDCLRAALTPLISHLPDSKNEANELRRLMARLATGDNHTIRREVMQVVFGFWARRMPEDLALWIASRQPGELSTRDKAIALASLQDDSVGHAKGYPQMQRWLKEQKPEEAARIVQQGILEAKVIHPRLLEDVRPWLDGPEREAVVLHAARAAWNEARTFSSADHPAEVAILWAAELEDPAVRDPLLYGLYQQGLRGVGANHIQDLADKINIPEEQRTILRRAKAEL